MDKQTAEYKLVKKSVNNKAIFNEIHKFIDEGITTGGVLWSNDIHRQSFVEIVADCLEEIQEQGLIDQYNVIGDLRNNTIEDMDNGIYVVEVSYRQTNCLNTTRLIYTITDLLIRNIRELITYTI